MSETPARLAERMASEGKKTSGFFKSLSSAQWDCIVYTQSPNWTLRHLLAHFVSAERAFGMLIADVVHGGGGAPEVFDIDAFNKHEVEALLSRTPFELLDEFESLRQVNVALCEQMQAVDLLKTGRHPFLGLASLEEMIKLLYRHNQIHQRDARRMLALETGDLPG